MNSRFRENNKFYNLYKSYADQITDLRILIYPIDIIYYYQNWLLLSN